jgi:hypothetical protein
MGKLHFCPTICKKKNLKRIEKTIKSFFFGLRHRWKIFGAHFRWSVKSGELHEVAPLLDP